ncbi:hypothetical protein U1Q18_045742 [Sarracenia purpurea var. burkii]
MLNHGATGHGLKLVKAIRRPLMLRRTKDSKDKEGRPILVLPPTDIQVIECEQSEAEHDFYNALFKRSKEFAYVNKLARRFLETNPDSVMPSHKVPTRAYVDEPVDFVFGLAGDTYEEKRNWVLKL